MRYRVFVDEDGESRATKNKSIKDSILVKTFAFGVNAFCIASYVAISGKIISTLGDEQQAASSLIFPYQAVLYGVGTGLMLSAGLEVGTHVGVDDFDTAGYFVRAGWVLATIMGAINTVAMLVPCGIFPLLFAEDTAVSAAKYFLGCALGNIPILHIIINSQVSFQNDDWYVPPVVGFELVILSSILSYTLGVLAGLGEFGVGLGGAIGALVTSISMFLWFRRETYDKYTLYQCARIPEFKKKMRVLLNKGWQLSLQRLNEWGSLMLMVGIMGILDNDVLEASFPSIQCLSLMVAALQGIALATGLLMKKNQSEFSAAVEVDDKVRASAAFKKNYQALLQNNAISLVACMLLGGLFHHFREQICQLFVEDPTSLEKDLFSINMLGLLPDAVRIVVTGGLRGWDDILKPTLISMFFMMVVGIPSGFMFQQIFKTSEPESDVELTNLGVCMFAARNIGIFASAAAVSARSVAHISADKKKISAIDNHLRTTNRHSL